MLSMTEVHTIRQLFYEEGKTITQIARETTRDRKSIRMYVYRDDWNMNKPRVESGKRWAKLNPFKPVIDTWLCEDKKYKRKQRHTATRVYHRLIEEYGETFTCSYRTVAGYVAYAKKELYGKQPGYLPLEHIPGEAQVDFGDAQFYENGTLYSGKYLDVSFPYSNNGYLQLFRGENQECLFEGLTTIFTHIGGVPPKLWFDNTNTIVSKVLKEGERKLTESFMRFREHYRFEAVFCNVGSGHEKGNVESKVGYHRRNMLVPVPRFTSLVDYNRELLSICDRDAKRAHYRKEGSIAELHSEDKRSLLELPTVPLDISRYISVKTNGYGRFYLNNGLHEYSVSPQYANSRIMVKITAYEVMPLDKNHRVLVHHPRLYGGSRQQSMQWLPYLTQLSCKPNALKYSRIYTMLPEPLIDYLQQCNRSETGKVLRVIAALTRKNGFEAALGTVKDALQYSATDIDSLLNLSRRSYDDALEIAPLRLRDGIPELDRVTSNLSAYDVKLGKTGTLPC